MKNIVYQRQIINGEEVMVVVEEYEVDNTISNAPSIEELQAQINNLNQQIEVLQNTIDAVVDPSGYIQGT